MFPSGLEDSVKEGFIQQIFEGLLCATVQYVFLNCESRISICIFMCVSFPNIIFCKGRQGRKNLAVRVE